MEQRRELDRQSWPVPTYAQQQACVQAMVNMLESTPFVERYALYNWVEDGRSLVTSSNTVTLAGTVYSNTVSSLSYSQAMPDNGTRGIAEYLFATNTWDTSGYYNNGMAIGAPAFTTGHNSQAQAIALDGTNSYVQLPANIAKGARSRAPRGCIGMAARTGSGFLILATRPQVKAGRFNICFSRRVPGAARCVSPSIVAAVNKPSNVLVLWLPVPATCRHHAQRQHRDSLRQRRASGFSTSLTIVPSAFSPIKNYLGKSQFTTDPLFSGKLDEVEIADYALTPAQISVLYHSTQKSIVHQRRVDNDANGIGATPTTGAAA